MTDAGNNRINADTSEACPAQAARRGEGGVEGVGVGVGVRRGQTGDAGKIRRERYAERNRQIEKDRRIETNWSEWEARASIVVSIYRGSDFIK